MSRSGIWYTNNISIKNSIYKLLNYLEDVSTFL
nr:hypothetical protein [Lactobacillus taiwanensis]